MGLGPPAHISIIFQYIEIIALARSRATSLRAHGPGPVATAHGPHGPRPISPYFNNISIYWNYWISPEQGPKPESPWAWAFGLFQYIEIYWIIALFQYIELYWNSCNIELFQYFEIIEIIAIIQNIEIYWNIDWFQYISKYWNIEMSNSIYWNILK